MIKAKPIITEMLNKVWEATSSLRRGDILSHEAIAAAAGIEPYSKHWTTIINKLKARFLSELSITLWSVRLVGYKLLSAEEQVNEPAVKRQKRASRQLFRAVNEVEATPDDHLSSHERQVKLVRVRGMSHMRNALQKSMKEQSVVRRTETPPLRMPMEN